MKLGPDDRFRSRPELVTREIVGETLIVPVSGELANLNEIFALNPSGACVWRHLDGAHTAASIRDAMVTEFEVGPDEAWRDLAALLEDLVESGLAERLSAP